MYDERYAMIYPASDLSFERRKCHAKTAKSEILFLRTPYAALFCTICAMEHVVFE